MVRSQRPNVAFSMGFREYVPLRQYRAKGRVHWLGKSYIRWSYEAMMHEVRLARGSPWRSISSFLLAEVQFEQSYEWSKKMSSICVCFAFEELCQAQFLIFRLHIGRRFYAFEDRRRSLGNQPIDETGICWVGAFSHVQIGTMCPSFTIGKTTTVEAKS